MHPITKRKLYCSNESPIVKTEAEQSFCYAPKEESGCILSKRFSGRLLLRQWRRRKKERNIHNSGCICRFALEFCNYKKERTETLYQSFSPFMVEHRRLELLTPTLPVLCATNCANAPRTRYSIAQGTPFVKPHFEEIWIFSRANREGSRSWVAASFRMAAQAAPSFAAACL